MWKDRARVKDRKRNINRETRHRKLQKKGQGYLEKPV